MPSRSAHNKIVSIMKLYHSFNHYLSSQRKNYFILRMKQNQCLSTSLKFTICQEWLNSDFNKQNIPFLSGLSPLSRKSYRYVLPSTHNDNSRVYVLQVRGEPKLRILLDFNRWINLCTKRQCHYALFMLANVSHCSSTRPATWFQWGIKSYYRDFFPWQKGKSVRRI